MRKLTLLATTAIAAIALAVAAAPANAGYDFYVADANSVPCNEVSGGVCIDTGFEGTFDIDGPAFDDTCDVSFDVNVTLGGLINTYNTDIDCHWTGVSECDDSIQGYVWMPPLPQWRQIHLPICLTGSPSSTHHIVFEHRNNPRRWVQIQPDAHEGFQIENAYIEDMYSPDNMKIIIYEY